MARIAIFHEKHGNRYFDIDQSGGWARVCMSILHERNGNRWFPKKAPKEPQVPQPPQDMEDLDALDKYVKAKKKHPQRVREYKAAKQQWDLLQTALAGDLQAAQDYIEARGRHEYEGYTIETTELPATTIPNWVYPLVTQTMVFEKAVFEALDALYTDKLDEVLLTFPDLIAKYRATTTTGPQMPLLGTPDSDRDYEKSTMFLLMAMERLLESTDFRMQHRIISNILPEAGSRYPNGKELERRRFATFEDKLTYARAVFKAQTNRDPDPSKHHDNVALDRIVKDLRF